jgi:hypothetical protein
MRCITSPGTPCSDDYVSGYFTYNGLHCVVSPGAPPSSLINSLSHIAPTHTNQPQAALHKGVGAHEGVTYVKVKVGDKRSGVDRVVAVLDRRHPHTSLSLEFMRSEGNVWLYCSGPNTVDVSGTVLLVTSYHYTLLVFVVWYSLQTLILEI